MSNNHHGLPSSSSHIASHLLSRSHSPSTAQTLFTEKVKQKPLLLHPSKPTALPSASASSSSFSTFNTKQTVDARTNRRLRRLQKKSHYLRKQKPRPLSAKEKRKLGVYDIPKDEVIGEEKWKVYLELHRLWVEYMWDILGLQQQSQQSQSDPKSSSGKNRGGGGGGVGGQKGKGQSHGQGISRQQLINAQNHGSLLATADYHGAKIEVVRSNCSGRVGTKGIVIRDTKFTFVVVLEGGKGVRSKSPSILFFFFSSRFMSPTPFSLSYPYLSSILWLTTNPPTSGHFSNSNTKRPQHFRYRNPLTTTTTTSMLEPGPGLRPRPWPRSVQKRRI